jgi:hypothetical protein
MFEKRTYGIWRGMMERCANPRHVSYRYYGARGICVCPEWLDFHTFLAQMGSAPADMTLDRKDNKKGYELSNCRWATISDQNNNKGDTRFIEFNGKSQNLTAWAREIGVSVQVLHHRIVKRHWPIDLALSLPLVDRAKRGAFRVEIK